MKRLSPANDYESGPLAWLGIIFVTCLTLFFFQRILWLVVPFLLALVMYYACLPLKLRLVLSGFSHDMAATIIGLGASLIIALALILAFPWITADAVNWQASSTRYLDGGVNFLLSTLRQFEDRFGVLAQAHLSEETARHISEFTDNFARDHLADAAMTLAAWAPSLLLAPFLAFFMLRDGWRFKKFIGRSVPNAFFERTLYLLDQVDRTARLYFVGLLQLTLLDTLCLAAGLWLLGVSGALLLGLITAVLAWVPYIGSIVGCVLVVLVAATDFPNHPEIAYGAVALFLLVRLMDDFFFMPLTVGKSLNIHPLLTVLMIFIGGAVAGIPGLMLVLPVLGVTMVFGETLGMVVTDPRLRARHTYARRLQHAKASSDLRC